MQRQRRRSLHLLRPTEGLSSVGENGTTAKLAKLAEIQAGIIRAKAGVGAEQRFDPGQVAGCFGVAFATPDDLEALSPSDRELIMGLDAKTWSGAGLPLPGGQTLVILNPHQTAERATVTIVEEIAHVHFRHSPSRIDQLPNGLIRREYDERVEREAYWTAAATLLPSEVVSRAVWRRVPVEELSSNYGVSTQLVEFRIKILRLWKPHTASLLEAT